MNSEAEAAGSSLDSAKLIVAVLLVVGGLAAYYYFVDVTRVVRVLGLVGAGLVALFIAAQTAKGRETTSFVRETQIEVRKVVWPTRDETMKTTGIVMLVVIVTALFLWLLDLALGGLTRWLMSLGG
ncbi:MAG: preprotein translocase subunit SecE [Gammaproteobacteria bacterium]|nr:preprotein translocase subunit SecE [Gammaproteobacteria bacterium]